MIIVLAKNKKKTLKDTAEIISEIKEELFKNNIIKEICKSYDFDLDIINGISIEFKDGLGTSAKTVNSKIFLSDELIDSSFDKIMRYVIHEFVHALQHMENEGKKDHHKGKEYLDRPDEIEAFQKQIKFEAEENGIKDAEKYVDDLIEYHEVDNKNKKKKELMKEI